MTGFADSPFLRESERTMFESPRNVLIPLDASGLGKDSVAVVSQVGPVSRESLEPHPVGQALSHLVSKIADGIRLVMGI